MFPNQRIDHLCEFGNRLRQRCMSSVNHAHILPPLGNYFTNKTQERRAKNGKGKPETFDFLGFTHYCSRAIKNGWFKVVRKTVARRMRVQLQEVKTELRRRLHRPLPETGRWLGQIIRGHMAYYAVPDNIGSVSSFVYHVRWLWYRALCRRSQRRRMNWTRFNKICERFFPPVRIMHPQPLHRFDAKTRERSPVR
jgi:RNA-directed DNA polymerase